MRFMSSDEIRKVWLQFFKDKGHRIIKSSPLIPFDDPTLLWINAGIAPLKKYFDGTHVPPSKKMANIQKCIRTNDITNVGITARHHTFFEMLGNFSVGDYFKKEAIEMGFELLTSEKYFNFPLEKLYFSYYPTDIDAKNVWLSLGVPETHLVATKDNYWEIGPGPSGPNTEIFYDRGSRYADGGIELIAQDIENDRYIEIWNIVFSQFNAEEGKKRSEYKELPHKNIDTGAGLERFASVLQGTETNFETDLFLPIIEELEKVANVKYTGQTSFKIIADHIKTLVMAISDGAVLSNEGRGYVLRRLLRRALKHGKELNIEGPFLTKLTGAVVRIMGDWYPEVKQNIEITNKIISSEEEKFLKTLSKGEMLVRKIAKEKNEINKEDSFLLFDTYGFPLELQEEYANEHKIKIDTEGFYELLKERQKMSRDLRKDVSSMSLQDESYLNFKGESKFVGYEKTAVTTSIIKVFDSGIVLEETPFYATKGGQIADTGTINDLLVEDVIELPNGQHLHQVDGDFAEGDIVVAKIDVSRRDNIRKNHTATHLLHHALKTEIGEHVNQQGSLVADDFLRFDFNNYESLTDEEILKIEKRVKDMIKEELEVSTNVMSYNDAIKEGATALFGEKYGDTVRVVSAGKDSVELCGGTHVKNTKEIIDFQISSIFSIGSGIYRIEAFSGANIIDDFKERNKGLFNEIETLKQKTNSLLDEIKEKGISVKYNKLEEPKPTKSYLDTINLRKYINELKQLNHQLEVGIKESLEKELLSNQDELIKNKRNNLIITKGLEGNILRSLLFELYDKIKSDTLLLLNIQEDKVTYLVRTNQNNARDIVNKLNEVSGGRGGGKNDFAMGGTSEMSMLDALIELMETI